MKTVCKFTCTLEIEIPERWADTASMKQIVEDAQRVARNKIAVDLTNALLTVDAMITGPKFQSITIVEEKP